MTERRAFINAITDNPDDRTACLVFADWLEERGDEAGAVLRRFVNEGRQLPRVLELVDGLSSHRMCFHVLMEGGASVEWPDFVRLAHLLGVPNLGDKHPLNHLVVVKVDYQIGRPNPVVAECEYGEKP